MINYKTFFFDIDGTIAESKQKITSGIAKKLSKLSINNNVAIISGASPEQILDKVISQIKSSAKKENIYLLPTSGASLYVYKEGKWKQIYNNEIKKTDFKKIKSFLRDGFKNAEVSLPKKVYGQRFEYRNSQITFSAHGQEAPLDIKEKWDPNRNKRKKVLKEVSDSLKDFEVKIGGTTSIDITQKGIDKEFGIRKLCDYLNIKPSEALFFGDSIFEGGNDYSALKSGTNTINVRDHNETYKILRHILCEQSFWCRNFNLFHIFRKYFGKKIEVKIKRLETNSIKNSDPYITRSHKNPILSPTSYSWESEGVFNPAAIYLNGRVHVLYRAIGANGVSTIGYASSADGINFDERLTYPVYYPRADFELDPDIRSKEYNVDKFSSGGGWCGCEDPKISIVGDRLFLFYVAFSGWDSVRVAMSSISIKDFLNKNWNWTVPILCSPKGLISKSGGIFPEKINGKYVFFQRIFPNILIDYLDDLRFDNENELPKGEKFISPSDVGWDSRKVSFGSTPIKTKHGWLVITHGVDDSNDSQYQIGAMILDYNNPEKVIKRSKKPILSPELWYENDWKPGILYPCGAVNKDGTLLIYYGGGDKYVCVASSPFDYFVESMMKDEKPKLKFNKIKFKKKYV
jgi:HAD superfamily hydrolase (TIGR01484 family)